MPQNPAEPGVQPPFKPMTFPARGDGLDEWCKEVTSGSIVAMCSDNELRALAVERLRAFNAASSRLPPDRQKILAADQNGWALSYPQRCSLPVERLAVAPARPRGEGVHGKGGPVAARLPASVRARRGGNQLADAAGRFDRNHACPGAGAVGAASVTADLATVRSRPEPAGCRGPRRDPGGSFPAAGSNPAGPAGRSPAKPSTADLLTGRGNSMAGFQGVAAIGAILVASVVVALWVWAAVRNRRRRIG